MAKFDVQRRCFVGSAGALDVPDDDDVSMKLAMLIEGECEDIGPKRAAHKYGYSRQRYFQLREAFLQKGACGLANQKRGPKTNYRRTSEVVCQVIRHRFLDPDAPAEVIAQKVRQCGLAISTRSVERIFADYGLQKKTLQVPPRS